MCARNLSGGVDAARDAFGRRHQRGPRRAVGRGQGQARAHLDGARRARGHVGLERPHLGVGVAGPEHFLAGRARARAHGGEAHGPQARGVRAEVVVRRAAAGEWGQRQQAVHLERAPCRPRRAVSGAHGGGEGDCLVPVPTRPVGERRRDGRPVHSLLEHFDLRALELRGHGQPGNGYALHLLIYTSPALIRKE